MLGFAAILLQQDQTPKPQHEGFSKGAMQPVVQSKLTRAVIQMLDVNNWLHGIVVRLSEEAAPSLTEGYE